MVQSRNENTMLFFRLDQLIKFLFYVASGMLFFMAIPISLEVLNRIIFGYSLPGIIECEELLLMWIVFLAMAYPQVTESHISVDILFMHISKRWQQTLLCMHWICIFVLTSLMTWYVGIAALAKWHAHEFTPDLNIPLYLFYVVTTFAVFVLALSFLQSLCKSLSYLVRNRFFSNVALAFVCGLCLLFLPFLLHDTEFSYSLGKVGALYIALLMVLIVLRMPLAFAMSLCGLMGMMTISPTPWIGLTLLQSTPAASISFTLTVIPMFILMGEFVLYAGIGKMLFNTARIWLGRLPGGLAISGIAGCAGFAAICGESLATALTMTSVALPEMRKHKYDPGLACASLAAGGTLGILIPPSIGFIIYALITEESVGRLFLAGVIPGILLTLMFSGVVIYLAWRFPELAPRGERTTWKMKLVSLGGVLPMGFLVLLILGGILSGLISPTEGGGVGAVGTLVYALITRTISYKDFLHSLTNAAELTTKIMAILVGVHLLGNFFAMTQLPVILAEVVTGFTTNKYVVLALVVLVYVVLGMLMNVVPMVLLTLPAIFPTILALGYDPIWFGVIMVILMEMGAITPPVGMVVFAIAGVPGGAPMGQIFRYITYFVLCQLALVVLLAIFPGLALWLPSYFY